MTSPSLLSLVRTSPLEAAATSYLERAAAGLILVFAAPALTAVLGTVRILSRREPLVAHLRVGQFGDPLWVFKVRTMWAAGPKPSPAAGWIEYLADPALPPSKAGLDPRVTSSFASFCRRHSIDELPQLLHVVEGRMRLVGPRPMTRIEVESHYAGAQAELLSVPPGLTGLWQVLGRNRLSYAQRRRLDLFLVRRYSWKLCASVLLRTVKEVLRPRDAW